MEKLRVLLIEDEDDNIKSYELCCGDDWDLTAIRHPKEVFDRNVDPNQFDLVIADLVFNFVDGKVLTPDPEDGRRLLAWLSIEKPGVPVMVVSGWVEPTMMQSLLKQYPKLQFVEKPVDLSSKNFRDLVAKAIKAHGHDC